MTTMKQFQGKDELHFPIYTINIGRFLLQGDISSSHHGENKTNTSTKATPNTCTRVNQAAAAPKPLQANEPNDTMKQNTGKETECTDTNTNTSTSTSTVASPTKFSDAWHEALVGRKIKLYWPMDKSFYRGVIKRVDLSSQTPVFVEYRDGDHEMVDLRREKFELYDESDDDDDDEEDEDDDDDDDDVPIGATLAKSRKRRRSPSPTPRNSHNAADEPDDEELAPSYKRMRPGPKRKGEVVVPVVYKCRFCGRVCPSPCKLTRHERTHTGAKPFGCDVCDYRAARKDHLLQHSRTHTGHKPHKCPLCPYATIYPQHLRPHMNTHTRAQPYECRFCHRRFSNSGNRATHVQRKHPSEVATFGKKYAYRNPEIRV